MTQPKVKLHWCADYATACLELNGLIAARYPDNPDALDDLTVQVVPCEVVGSAMPGRALSAFPTAEGPRPSNLLMVYFGEHPAPIMD